MVRKMKDSGIEWIGEIPEGWEIGQIGQLYSERRTKVSDKDYPPLSVTMKGILPQLSTAAKTDAHDDRKLVCKGDFAINSRSDRRGSCGISEQDGSISLINTVLQPRGEMNPGYYNWLFHTSMFADEFYKWGHGIVDDLWTTGWSDMKKIGVPVPSKCEQKQLAEHLNFECSNIDTILSKTRSSIEEYKKLKQAVITQAVTKGVRGEREMKDSGVEWAGLVPHHWGVAKIGSIGQTSSGATPLRSKEASFFDDATIRWVRTLDLNDGLVYDSLEKITELALASSACSIMPKGTVCVAMYGGAGTIGKCGLLMSDCATNQAVCSIVCNREIVSPIFLLMQLLALKSYWMKYAVGTRKDPNISQDVVARMKILIPPLDEQKEITDYLDAKCAEIDGLIAKKEQLVKELESYKKSLIYEVVTGKREV